jgi:hypothetical protein
MNRIEQNIKVKTKMSIINRAGSEQYVYRLSDELILKLICSKKNAMYLNTKGVINFCSS